jgi:hypothetical protein
MDLGLSGIRIDFVRLPSGESLREAEVGHFEIGPLHSYLGKGVGEPSWIGRIENDSERKLF